MTGGMLRELAGSLFRNLREACIRVWVGGSQRPANIHSRGSRLPLKCCNTLEAHLLLARLGGVLSRNVWWGHLASAGGDEKNFSAALRLMPDLAEK